MICTFAKWEFFFQHLINKNEKRTQRDRAWSDRVGCDLLANTTQTTQPASGATWISRHSEEDRRDQFDKRYEGPSQAPAQLDSRSFTSSTSVNPRFLTLMKRIFSTVPSSPVFFFVLKQMRRHRYKHWKAKRSETILSPIQQEHDELSSLQYKEARD